MSEHQPINRTDPASLVLQGSLLRLCSLERKHIPELQTLAADKRIWAHYIYDCSQPQILLREIDHAFRERDRGSQVPLVIQRNSDGALVGSTRLLDIQPSHRKAEIGWTWMHPDVWGSALNIEAKLLLLSYCFEELQLLRVCLKTDELNTRSRKAIEKIGARFEGVLRNDMLRENGTSRNSAYYSIIDSEWLIVKAALRARLDDNSQSTLDVPH